MGKENIIGKRKSYSGDAQESKRAKGENEIESKSSQMAGELVNEIMPDDTGQQESSIKVVDNVKAEEPEEEIKFPVNFDIKDFRTKLHGDDFIKELRHFLYLHNTGKRIVEKYLERRGSPLELSEAFKRIDHTNLHHVAYLSEALRIVLEHMATQELEEKDHAADTCRFFLKAHSDLLKVLLKSGNAEHRKTCIGLITVAAVLAPMMIRTLLNSFDVYHDKGEIEAYLSHKAGGGDLTVRQVFIKLILSLLVDGTTFVIRVLLDKYELVAVALYGLVYDDYEVVVSVLTAFKKCVVESLLISKTKKIRVFDSTNINSLLRLYFWKGPRYYRAKNKTKSRALLEFIELDKQEVVRQCVNDFLILLLSNRRYGLAFDAMTKFGQRKNVIQKKTLALLSKPWQDPLKKRLTIEILLACPELAEGMIRHVGYGMMGENEIVLKMLIFISEIVTALSPEVMRSGLAQISLNRFARWVKELCLPLKVLEFISKKEVLKSQATDRRVAAARTLSILFRQYCNYMLAIIEREKFKGNELRKFRFEMLDYLFLNFPSVESILASLYMTIHSKSSQILQHMDYTFDLLMSMCKTNRSFVDKTSAVVDYIRLLDPLLDSLDDPETVAVKLKGIKLLLMLNPKSFLPSQDIYFSIVENLCCIYMTDRSGKLNVAPILQKLLLNSNLFDNGPLEVDIWLEAMRFVDNKLIHDIAKCWSLIAVEKEVDMVPFQKIDYISKSNLKGLFRDVENGVTIEGFVDLPVMSKALVLMLQNAQKFPNCSRYFELVAFFLFHFIPAPRYVQEVYSQHFSAFYKYMLAWLDKEKAAKLVTETIPRFNEMYFSLVEGRLDFEQVFKGDEKFLLDGRELSLDPILHGSRYVLLLIYQTCFVVAQLAEKKHLEAIQSNAASHYLIKLLQLLHLNDESQKDEINAFDVNPSDDIEVPYVKQALKYIYNRHLPFLQNFHVMGQEASDRNFVKFICDLAEAVKHLNVSDFLQLAVNYCSKIVNQIVVAIGATLQSNTIPPFDALVAVLEAFGMSEENCLKLLEHLSSLKAQHFVVDKGNRSAYFDILVFVLNRLTESKKIFLVEDCVIKISSLYVRLIRKVKVEFSLEKLEEALYNFLTISRPCIGFVSTDVFHCIFRNPRISKSSVKFASLLMAHRKDLINEFIALLPEQVSKKELIYPLLGILIDSQVDPGKELLGKVYQECKSGIMKTIEKPQKAAVIYKENVETSIHLLQKCMPNTDFYKTTLKLESVELFQLQMVDAIYKNEMAFYASNPDTQALIVRNCLNNLMQCLMVVTKREAVDGSKVSSICWHIFSWISDCKLRKVEYDATEITNSQQWQNLCKTCLKFGMRAAEEPEDEQRPVVGCDDTINSEFLKLLAFLFDEFYQNESMDGHAATCFEMVMSHSRFFDIVFTKKPTRVKTEVMHLLLVLARKNSTVIKQKCLPILLGAYQAKLSVCDRYTLALLQYFQQCGVVLPKNKSLFWGESAIEQYSLRDEKPTLLQERSLTNTMSVVERHVCDLTVNNFPIWRSVNTLSQLPAVEFVNPHIDWNGWGSTALERKIEAGRIDFDEASLKSYPVGQQVYDECYDPAFMIPLLNRHLGGGSMVHPVVVVKNGLLQIAFAALSSMDVHMRMAAGYVHIRYREMFETNMFLDKPLWTTAYQNVQTGLVALSERWKKHKTIAAPRVPFVSGLFLAVAMTTLVDPLDPMYKVLSMYLRVKAKFEFLCVPEFNVLFHSTDVDHSTHRKFLLDIIRNGVKCSSDLFLLVTTGTLKALMGFYDVPVLSPPNVRLKILAVFGACVKIPAMIKCMIENMGVLVWLSAVIEATNYYYFDTIETIIELVNDIWYSIKAVEESQLNLANVEQRIFQLLAKLLPLISSRLSLKSFAQFVNIFGKTLDIRHHVLTDKSLDHLIECSQRHFPDHIWHVQNIKEFGVECSESSKVFAKNLKDSKLDDLTIFALLALRKVIVRCKEASKPEKCVT